MDGFVKIYGSKLITSSLWDEIPEARLVFLSMLSIADATGYVDVPNERALARVLNLPLDYVADALAVLMAPDSGSRTSDHEGRRVLRDGSGWRCVNYEKYREFRSAAQESARVRAERFRDKHTVTNNGHNATVTPITTEGEAEAEEEAEEDRIGVGATRADSFPPVKPSEPPVLSFPASGKPDAWGLSQNWLDEAVTAFPGVDVLGEMRIALAKVKTGACRKPTAKGMSRFLMGWLGRANDRKPVIKTNGTPQSGHLSWSAKEQDATVAAAMQLSARREARRP